MWYRFRDKKDAESTGCSLCDLNTTICVSWIRLYEPVKIFFEDVTHIHLRPVYLDFCSFKCVAGRFCYIPAAAAQRLG